MPIQRMNGALEALRAKGRQLLSSRCRSSNHGDRRKWRRSPAIDGQPCQGFDPLEPRLLLAVVVGSQKLALNALVTTNVGGTILSSQSNEQLVLDQPLQLSDFKETNPFNISIQSPNNPLRYGDVSLLSAFSTRTPSGELLGVQDWTYSLSGGTFSGSLTVHYGLGVHSVVTIPVETVPGLPGFGVTPWPARMMNGAKIAGSFAGNQVNITLTGSVDDPNGNVHPFQVTVTATSPTTIVTPTPPATPPHATGVVSVGHSKKGLTSVTVAFDEALNSASVGNLNLYMVLGGVKKRKGTVYSQVVRVSGASYNANAHTVTINLAKPYKGAVQVTVHGGIVAANGAPSVGDFTAIVK